MRKQKPEYPLSVRDLRDTHDSGCGGKKRKDANSEVSAERSPLIMQVLESTTISK